MATANPSKRVVPPEMALQATVMAIREELMNYYKGTCIERFTTDRNIHLRRINGQSRYSYQRRLADNEWRSILYIGDAEIFELTRSPECIIFIEQVLNRSPQLRQVKEEIQRFMSQYLPAVETVHLPATSKVKEVDDSKLLVTKVRLQDEPQMYSPYDGATIQFARSYTISTGTSISDNTFNDLFNDLPF